MVVLAGDCSLAHPLNRRSRRREPGQAPPPSPPWNLEKSMTPTWPEPITPPAGNAARFGSRWRLVGAGLSNVWRFGDLGFLAPSRRRLLRGPDGPRQPPRPH